MLSSERHRRVQFVNRWSGVQVPSAGTIPMSARTYRDRACRGGLSARKDHRFKIPLACGRRACGAEVPTISSFLPLLEFGRPQPESCDVPLVQICKLCEGDARKAIEVFRRDQGFRQARKSCLGGPNLFAYGMAHDIGDLAAILEAEGIGLRKRVAHCLVSAY